MVKTNRVTLPNVVFCTQIECFLLEFDGKKFLTFSIREIFEKNQSLYFEKLDIPFFSKFETNSKYNRIYVYLRTKTAKNIQ